MEGPVSITPQDHAEMIDLLNLCFREEGGDMLADYPRHVGLSNQNNIRVIKEKGKIVSHLATSVRPVILGGISTAVAGVGAVATHPDARGKGYASMLMEDTIRRSEAQGADILLISNDLNLYRRHHARLCGRFPWVEIHRDEVDEVGGMECHPAVESDLNDIIRLRASLSTRYLLPREDMEALIRHKRVMDRFTDWWMIRDPLQSVGFGAIEVNTNAVHLSAWAGQPDALRYAVPFWLKLHGKEQFTFYAVHKAVLPVQWKRFIRDTVVFEGSVIVLNGVRLLEQARHYIEERVGRQSWSAFQVEGEKQRLTIRDQNQSITWNNGGELAESFFGLPFREPLAGKIPQDSHLYAVLSSFLPLPLVWYGLGYV